MAGTADAPSRASDREALAAALLAVGPDAPTLCEGWAARDLAVHLLVRDARPDVALGQLVGHLSAPVRRAAAQRQAALEALPYEEVVERVRGGPPAWSPARAPAVERAVNGVEFFVHAEDVRRAAPGWRSSTGEPDDPGGSLLRAGQREQLWRSARSLARLQYRRSPVGVVLAVPAGPRAAVRRGTRGSASVVLTGQPEELVLHAFGRRSVARVEVGGPADAVAAFEEVYPAPGPAR